MKYFTWTDATKKVQPCSENGNYREEDTVDYYGYMQMVLPNDMVLETDYYQGYGIVGKRDMFEVLAECNREYLDDVVDFLKQTTYLSCLIPIVRAYQTIGEEAANSLAELTENGRNFVGKWKRTVGVILGCELKNSCQYPLKVTSQRGEFSYEELYPSVNVK